MTIEELRAIVADVATKVTTLANEASALHRFISQISGAISEENPFSSTIDIDAFVAIQTPLYLAYLTTIETAADALGTDAFH